jgi:DUF917 family protein
MLVPDQTVPVPALTLLEETDLPVVAQGCAVLGAGGGGDPDLALAMARRAIREHGPVRVLAVDTLDPDDVLMPCGLVGSPTVATERIPSGDEAGVLCGAVEDRRGAPVVALMPYEIGGANGLFPIAWAARLGLPLVDADTMGRAFPSLRQLAVGRGEVSVTPMILTDGRGNALVIDAADDAWAERLARDSATSLGGVCAIALACMSGREARAAAVGGSLSRALVCGAEPDCGGTPLIEGRVQEIARRLDGTLIGGSATVQGTGADRGRRLRLELQSEFLLALEDGEIRAAVPDIIAVIAQQSRVPLATERLRQGQRVRVVALEAPATWRTPEGLAAAGPPAFGLDIPYTPISAPVHAV